MAWDWVVATCEGVPGEITVKGYVMATYSFIVRGRESGIGADPDKLPDSAKGLNIQNKKEYEIWIDLAASNPEATNFRHVTGTVDIGGLSANAA